MRLQMIASCYAFLGDVRKRSLGYTCFFLLQYSPTFKLAQATDSNENTREIKVLNLPTTACLKCDTSREEEAGIYYSTTCVPYLPHVSSELPKSNG
jgi:hypothetical protein